jgi:tripartite-type tricarboxylate transporter receptor subunit TctC
MITRRAFVYGAGAAALVGSGDALAQAGYPTKPVRMVAGFPAGSGLDIFGRLYAQKLAGHLNSRFFVENVTGQAGNLASTAVARAEADGYTLLLATNGNKISTALYKQLRYKFPDDFDPIAGLVSTRQVLVVGRSSGINSVGELIELAKQRPGEINCGNSGVGGGPHLTAALFSVKAGIKLGHIAYRGTTEAIPDLITGRISMMFSVVANVRSVPNDVRILAVAAPQRMPSAPDIPTLAESGVPDVEVMQWYGLVAPKGTPSEILTAVADGIKAANASEDVQKKVTESGSELSALYLDDYKRFLVGDARQWADAVKLAGIQIE